ncbi:hypothetical protein B0H14DRAFT_2594640 [Mycena olivaceomarginata]|nr:hypothetical protein B0H14DRAFT_2594640 [Mycena olivaceomarginata]
MLSLLSLLGGSLVMLTLGARLGIYGYKNPHQLAYMLTYFAICSGSANVFIATPSLAFFLHVQSTAEPSLQEVALHSIHHGIPVQIFSSRPWVSSWGANFNTFTSPIEVVKFEGDPAEVSTSRPSRTADHTKMKNAIADDIAVKNTSTKKCRRKTGLKTAAQSKGKGKAREDENTDPEDNNFLGSGSDGETSDENSDSSIEILNSELAESLSTKTIAENARRSTKVPPRENRKGAEASSSAVYFFPLNLGAFNYNAWDMLGTPMVAIYMRHNIGIMYGLVKLHVFKSDESILSRPSRGIITDNTDGNATMAGPSTTGPSTPSQQPQAPSPQPSRIRSVLIVLPTEKIQPNLLFYEGPTDCDTKGKKDEGAKYYKCSSKAFKSGHRSRTLLSMWDHCFDA